MEAGCCRLRPVRLRITCDSALNLDFQEWASAFPNRLLGAATLDRLRHAAYTVILEGDSYRSLGPSSRGPQSPLEKEAENP